MSLNDRQFAEQYFSNFTGKESNNFTENLGIEDEMYSNTDFDGDENRNREAGLDTFGLLRNNFVVPFSNCRSNYTDIKKKVEQRQKGTQIGMKIVGGIIILILAILIISWAASRAQRKTA